MQAVRFLKASSEEFCHQGRRLPSLSYSRPVGPSRGAATPNSLQGSPKRAPWGQGTWVRVLWRHGVSTPLQCVYPPPEPPAIPCDHRFPHGPCSSPLAPVKVQSRADVRGDPSQKEDEVGGPRAGPSCRHRVLTKRMERKLHREAGERYQQVPPGETGHRRGSQPAGLGSGQGHERA